jgi:pyruvate kinase
VTGGLVKVLATLGPSSMDKGVVAGMAEAGASGFRVNLSHGGPGEWDSMVEAALAAEEAAGRPIALIADLEGPRVRLGEFEPVKVPPGGRVRLTVPGRLGGGVPVDWPGFIDVLEEGDRVLVDDGRVVLVVERLGDGWVEAVAPEGGVLEPRKGVAVAGKDMPLPPLTGKDLRDLEYIARRPFSHVMLSYTRSPEHVGELRSHLRRLGAGGVGVIAKIETPGGVAEARSIAEASDAVVVARGDLGMHYPLEELPRVQAEIVEAARSAYKPVIVATQLLSSMVEEPTPSRSDVMDVYVSARMGVDALLLTAETAVGRYPVEAVRWLARIAEAATRGYRPPAPEPEGREYQLAAGIVEMAEKLRATLLVYSMTGRFPERLSAFRPSRPYHVGLPTREAARRVAILWGAVPHVVPAASYDEGLEKMEEQLGGLPGGPRILAAWRRLLGRYRVEVAF